MNLADSLRTALLGVEDIAAPLSVYNGDPAIFTRRPVPADATYPLIAISPDVVFMDKDFINSRHNSVIRDIAVYGNQPADYRIIEAIGYAIRDLFHRNKFSLVVAGFHVIRISAMGPIPAPADDKNTVARMVSLSIDIQPTS